jgi:hypothetical protein
MAAATRQPLLAECSRRGGNEMTCIVMLELAKG